MGTQGCPLAVEGTVCVMIFLQEEMVVEGTICAVFFL